MMRNQQKFTMWGSALVALLLLSESAMAIPVFARKYQTSCITCHDSFPRLNATGEAFRLNGYRFLDDEVYIKEEPVEMGDEAYKKVWPEAVWPADIPGLPPVSFVLQNRFLVDLGGTGDARTEFVFPREAEIISAGTLGDNVSFFLEFEFEKEAEDRGETEIETDFIGWVQFEDLLGKENAFNVRAGTMGINELGLFTARNHNRMTLNKYLYSSWRLPTPSQSAVDTAFGAGTEISANRFRLASQPGVEVNGFGKRWQYAVGVVNGNESINDDNSDKDIYLQTSYKFGGASLDGSSQEEGASLGRPQSWQDDSLTLSLFGYWGKGTIEIGGMEDEDRFWRIGPGARWKCKDFALNTGIVFGRNDDLYGPLDEVAVDSYSWFVEGEYFIYPWLSTTARYEALKLDLAGASAPGSTFIANKQDLQRVILNAKALVRANISLTLETRLHIEDELSSNSLGGETNDSDELAIGMSIVF